MRSFRLFSGHPGEILEVTWSGFLFLSSHWLSVCLSVHYLTVLKMKVVHSYCSVPLSPFVCLLFPAYPFLSFSLSLYCMSHFRALWLVQVLTKRAYLYRSFVLTFFRSSYLMVRMFGSCLCFHHSRVYSNQQPLTTSKIKRKIIREVFESILLDFSDIFEWF